MITEEKTYLCRVVNDSEVEKFLWKIEYVNENNNVIESKTFSENGEVIRFEKREFSNGNLKRLVEVDYENQVEQEKTYKYQDGLLVQERTHFENGTYYNTNYSYDKNENILSIIRVDESNVILGKEINTYESNSQLVQYFDENEFIYRQEEIEFDNSKRAKKKESEEFFINEKNEEEVIESIETYEYDAIGNEVKIEIERYNKTIYREESKYDHKNNISEITTWSNETDTISKYEFKYDHKGKKVMEALFENDKLVSKFDYFYDHQDKLVKIDKTYQEVDDYYITYRETIERRVTPPNKV